VRARCFLVSCNLSNYTFCAIPSITICLFHLIRYSGQLRAGFFLRDRWKGTFELLLPAESDIDAGDDQRTKVIAPTETKLRGPIYRIRSELVHRICITAAEAEMCHLVGAHLLWGIPDSTTSILSNYRKTARHHRSLGNV
jgi:hypothetical protein